MIISEQYDAILSGLQAGVNQCFVPVRGGVYRSMFAPMSAESMRKAERFPTRFALVACQRTREYARMKGYEVN